MKNLILVAIATFAISAYGARGQEGGGGGDAVIQNGEMVIRDLLTQNVSPVIDQKAFLKSVPGFDQLMKEIGKVNPDFATHVIEDLLKSHIYLSRKSLPILPHQQTALNGVRASVQIAVRYGDDIIFAPEFAKLSPGQRKYVLIHEALHGLLMSDSGPLHHDRVRSIVNYLYNNEGKLDKKTFEVILERNKFFSTGVDSLTTAYKYLWDENTEPVLRCYQMKFMSSHYDDVIDYLNVECPDLWTTLQNMKQKYPEIVAINKYYSGRESQDSKLRDEFVLIPLWLVDPKSINKHGKQAQENRCAENEKEFKKIADFKLQMDAATASIEKLRAQLGEEKFKDLLIEYTSSGLARIQNRLQKDAAIYSESLASYQKGRVQCEKYYPKKEWLR